MSDREDRAWPVMAAGLVVSLLAHGAGVWWLVRAPSARAADQRREIDLPEVQPPPPPSDEVTLGQTDAKQASITWLGVREDPREGRAPEAEVDQAALTPNPGAQPVPQPTPAEPAPEVADRPEQPEPQPQVTPTIEEPSPVDTPDAAVDPVEEAPEQPAGRPPQPAPPESVEVPVEPPPGPALVPEPVPEPESEPDPRATEPVQDPEPETPPQPEEPDPSEREPQASDTPPAVMGPPLPPTPTPTEPKPTPAPTPSPQGGEPGEQADREAEAALRKQAIDVEMDDLARPLAGKGLEIKPVRPEWPTLVRQSYLPRNPVVVIRFGADGKVKKAEFLREPDGTKGTGAKPVDGPLLDAVYRWTASGPKIDALDKSDPDAEVVIPIRMLLGRRTPGG